MLLAGDFNTHLYAELITAISRTDTTVLTSAMAAAEGEARGYLSRYDTATLFTATGTDRDPVLLMYLKDLAAWHFITLANADVDLELRKTRYDDAIAWLKGIQSGKIVYPDWPLPVEETQGDNDLWQVSSRPRRETNY